MAYIVKASVKKFFNNHDRQLSADGMHAIEIKLVEFMEKICKKWNGHHKRVTATIVNVTNIN